MKELKFETNFFGYYQIIGGVLGLIKCAFLILALWGMSNYFSFDLSGLAIPFLFLFILLFLFSCYAGWLCLKQQKNFLLFSKINQLLQLVSVALAGFTYLYCAGIFLNVGFDITENFKLTFNAGTSTFSGMLGETNNAHFLTINLIAVILLRRIHLMEERIANNDFEESPPEMGAIGEQILDV